MKNQECYSEDSMEVNLPIFWNPFYPKFMRLNLCIIFKHHLSRCDSNSMRTKQEPTSWRMHMLLQNPDGDKGTKMQ